MQEFRCLCACHHAVGLFIDKEGLLKHFGDKLLVTMITVSDFKMDLHVCGLSVRLLRRESLLLKAFLVLSG
jgi:hypothetical protein